MQLNKGILGILLVLLFFSGCIQQPEQTYICPDGTEVFDPSNCELEEEEQEEELVGCTYNNPSCELDHVCVENECILKQGCNYDNPACDEDSNCISNECVLNEGCTYDNPSCEEDQTCVDNSCFESCIGSNDCNDNEVCFDNICAEVECKEDLDCDSPKLECKNYECDDRSKCLVDMNCDADEVCVAQVCSKFLDCTSGECEDDYFKLEDITIEESIAEILIRAKITPKTEIKGSFRIVWNEVESAGSSTSIAMEYEEEDSYLPLWIYLTNPTFSLEHYIIEHVETPNLYYLIEQHDYYE